MTPIVKLLRLTDSTAPTASKIYYNMYRIQQLVKEAEPSLCAYLDDIDEAKEEVIEMVRLVCYRWDYGYTPIQGVGFLLDPEFWDMEANKNEEIMDAFYLMLVKTFPLPDGLVLRDGVDDSIEVTDDDFEHEDNSEELIKAGKEAVEQRAAASRQLIDYINKSGTFSIKFVQQHARTMSACSWWDAYGYKMPELQLLAMRVLGQVRNTAVLLFQNIFRI